MSENKRPFLGLNIIVKNEEKVIKRLLDTVTPIIDYYCIIDTGSTDRTKEIAKEVMDAAGIPGEIHDHEWINFCAARTFALEKIEGKCEWAFWIDADEQLIYDPKFQKESLKANFANMDCVSMEVEYGPQTYFRTQFFRPDFQWKWIGAVHEVLVPRETAKAPRGGQIKGLTTLVTPDGASWGDNSRESQRQKYSEHAELLLEYIKGDPDVRWLFYLGQSYRDSFQWKESEEWYAKRAAATGGYWEERYFAQLMVASMKANQQKPAEEILEAYAQCSKFDPNRCEHYMPIVKHHQATGNWPYSYILSKFLYDNYSGKNPFPRSSLFIDKAVYDWQILDLHCIGAYWMGKHAEARSCYNKLRKACNKGLVPEAEVKRIIANQEWYTKKHEQEKMNQIRGAVKPLSTSSTMPDANSKIKVGKPSPALNFRP